MGKKIRAFRNIPVLVLAALFAAYVPCHAAWQMVWNDEFDTGTIDSAKWTFETGNNNGWGNIEREYYTARATNAYVSDGTLKIVARKETTNGFPYTSARMKTQGRFSKTYGRIEFRARMPKGRGYWPALWALGDNITSLGWPACGEIDIMEFNGSWSNQVQGTIHYSDSANNHLQQTSMFTFPAAGDSATNFHIYALEWTTNTLKWIVDTTTVKTWTTWSSSSGPYPAPFNKPFFLLMNVAVGGSYLGNPTDAQINADTVFPGAMEVDYVRVYENVASPPLTPQNLKGQSGDSRVYLEWDAADGAAGYRVKRAASASGPFVLIGTTTDSNYIDATAMNCTAYYYSVSATNALGESRDTPPLGLELGAQSVAVNCGGPAAGLFAADTGFSGGTVPAASTASIIRSGVSNPAPEVVYQTERYGNFSFTSGGLTPRGTYHVRLHLAETYWTASGQRRFNVSANGAAMLQNYDIIAAAGGPNRAVAPEFDVAANASGQIILQFATVTDNAKCDGVEILKPRTASPQASSNGPVWSGAALNLTASSIPGASYTWTGPNGFVSNEQNPSIPEAFATASGQYTVVATINGCASAPASTAVAVRPLVNPSAQALPAGVVISWTDGTLVTSTNLSGNWTEVPGATSPYTNPVTGPQGYFRLRFP